MIVVSKARYAELEKLGLSKEELKGYEVDSKPDTLEDALKLIDELQAKNKSKNNESKEAREAREALEKRLSDFEAEKKAIEDAKQEALQKNGDFEALLKAEQTKTSELANQLNDASSYKERFEQSQEVINQIRASKLSQIQDEAVRDSFKDASFEQIDVLLNQQSIKGKSQESDLGGKTPDDKLTGNAFQDSVRNLFQQ